MATVAALLLVGLRTQLVRLGSFCHGLPLVVNNEGEGGLPSPALSLLKPGIG
jgi:hypothetical protein